MSSSNSPLFPWVNLLLVLAFLAVAIPLSGFVRSVQGAEMRECIVFVSDRRMDLFRELWGYALKFSGIYPVIYSNIPDIRVVGPDVRIVVVGETKSPVLNCDVVMLTGSVNVADVVRACGLGGER